MHVCSPVLTMQAEYTHAYRTILSIPPASMVVIWCINAMFDVHSSVHIPVHSALLQRFIAESVHMLPTNIYYHRLGPQKGTQISIIVSSIGDLMKFRRSVFPDISRIFCVIIISACVAHTMIWSFELVNNSCFGLK